MSSGGGDAAFARAELNGAQMAAAERLVACQQNADGSSKCIDEAKGWHKDSNGNTIHTKTPMSTQNSRSRCSHSVWHVFA